VAGLAPQVFTAVAVESPDRCGGERQLAVASTFDGQLTALDCTGADGRLFEHLGIPLLGGEYIFSLTSSEFDAALEIVDAYGTPIAANDNANAASTNSVITGLFAAGRPMTAVVSAARAGAGGPFTIRYDTSSSFDNCDQVFTMRGISAERMVQGRNAQERPAPTMSECSCAPESRSPYASWITIACERRALASL